MTLSYASAGSPPLSTSFRLFPTIFLALMAAIALLACSRPHDASSPNQKEEQPAPQQKTPQETSPTSAPASNEKPSGPSDVAGTEASGRLASLPQLLPPSRRQEGWVMLFDGETLFGWEPVGQARWQVVDGVIVGDGTARGFLRTTTAFGDYELELDFRAPDTTNSGVFLHTKARPGSPQTDCYELNIAPGDNPYPTGSFVKRQRVEDEMRLRALKAGDGEWHHYHVVVRGGHVTVELNGVRVLDYDDPKPLRRGYIALQQNSGPVAFRNIVLRPLGLEPLFDGKTLEGWRTHPDLKGTFTVTPAGELRVQGGRGQLETKRSFGDFVLQLEAKTSAPNMNSGVFFRCIPKDVMMGYESQIHNGYRDGDRTRPVDCGTGGIFRRQNARIVASDDGQWFTKTIVAQGRHFAVWVNGLQVTDWNDDRPPHDNPRRGFRKEAGTIMLQAHDPTTDVLFRHLSASELPTRP